MFLVNYPFNELHLISVGSVGKGAARPRVPAERQ